MKITDVDLRKGDHGYILCIADGDNESIDIWFEPMGLFIQHEKIIDGKWRTVKSEDSSIDEVNEYIKKFI